MDDRYFKLVDYADLLGRQVWVVDPDLIEPFNAQVGIVGPIKLSSSFENEDVRLYTLAHEIGHCIDFQNVDRTQKFYEIFRKDPTLSNNNVLSVDDRRFLFDQEVIAYRIADDVIEKLGITIDGRIALETREGCLESYRRRYSLEEA